MYAADQLECWGAITSARLIFSCLRNDVSLKYIARQQLAVLVQAGSMAQIDPGLMVEGAVQIVSAAASSSVSRPASYG